MYPSWILWAWDRHIYQQIAFSWFSVNDTCRKINKIWKLQKRQKIWLAVPMGFLDVSQVFLAFLRWKRPEASLNLMTRWKIHLNNHSPTGAITLLIVGGPPLYIWLIFMVNVGKNVVTQNNHTPENLHGPPEKKMDHVKRKKHPSSKLSIFRGCVYYLVGGSTNPN